MVENEDKLLEIVDREVEVIIPAHFIFLRIRGQQATAFLLDDVDNILELLPVTRDQIIDGDLPQIANAFYTQVIENVWCVVIDKQILKRQLRKAVSRFGI